ncbi:MAG: TetR/AcrR family transcriptional regulator [Betaproteobacteria bacterium]|nr:TetR/AcrR family transcriptional regulator [Betaproteobacteria bacterium]
MAGTRAGKTSDRRVARTHGALREALISLISERGWDAISVQDVCDRANIGRSTFYAHFASKEKLLISGFDELRRALRAQAGMASDARTWPFGFVRGLIEHAHENQRLFRAVIGKRSGLVVQRHFRHLLIELVAEELTDDGIAMIRRDAAAHYIAGALFELLNWWIDSRSPLAPSELEAMFRELTTPVLGVARSSAQNRRPVETKVPAK